MAKTALPPKIKTLFTPTTFVCLLALSLCSTPTSTHALPISSKPSADQPQRESILSIDTKGTPSSLSSTDSPSHCTPFRTVSRPITIQVDLNAVSESSPSLTLLIERTERHEQFLRQREQQDQEELVRLQQEQDELEKVEQDRDQLLDNQEEEQLDQDPETVRRRQEESLGLWMTDAEFEALSQEANADNNNDVHDGNEESILLNKGSRFDLYAEDFKEVTTPDRIRPKKQRLERQLAPTEEEMLQWPIINLSEFEDRQDEVQDEYDEQA
ncbi:hypothetical protein BC939DRAFT_467123 [Gamsiella multidivaricata]|uniref:uncharacterized protein n=1 Tax=Gamsiella multidivaricata TaxID=101098 RepID=UPI002220030C|nr:uncharacterized protein BC939DRAFT_467123 [Gamsiella multidivaricata]KAG0365359.1 hypothetical protein BGZ54_006585 [Gamsiella multidivaricata]KAI7817069.1 hypothetical protein BC939DRAFT_467123 [Gamsiella multidivaricata]